MTFCKAEALRFGDGLTAIEAHAVVFHGQGDFAVFFAGRDPQMARSGFRTEAMLQRVFHQWLKDKGRHLLACN